MIKPFYITTIIVTLALPLKAQEWDDPVTTSNWDQLWKSSFVQSNNGTNAPESSGWFWGINMNHSSNSSTYRYNGQLAIKNDNDSPTMYFRSTNSNGSGVWAKVVNMRPSSIGTLTTINSLRVHGNNLHGDDLTFMNNSASMLVGWNRSASHGETDFISNRGAGSLGGFEFRDIDNSGNETLLMRITGEGNGAIYGKLESKEVKVQINPTTVPDYVFSGNYDLRTLEETQEYIVKNQHLPEIPSAAEIEESGGIDIGDMNMKLLKKIEELTLYLIEQNKELKSANMKIEQLQKELSALETR